MPALHAAWDHASTAAQRAFFSGHQRLLWLVLAGALAGAAPSVLDNLLPQDSKAPVRQFSSGIAAILLCVCLWMTSELRAARKAEAWYDGRALAESAKSMAWKFMMKAEPYGAGLSPSIAERLFCDDLQRLLSDAGERTLSAASHTADGDQITAEMRKTRALPVAERLERYQTQRIATQRAWYKQRSAKHEQSANWWFRVVVALNVLAIAFSVCAIFWTFASSVVAVITTAVSAVIAWNQLHRYGELAHSYARTSHEMGLLEPRATSAALDDDLARFVADCETAISREHTMWRARREADS